MDDLANARIGEFAERLAAATPAPGGGAAAGLVGMLAAALARMAAALTVDRRRYEAAWEAAEAAMARAEAIRLDLLEAAAEDALVYRQVSLLLQHQTADNTETAVRALEDALTAAAHIPLKVVRLTAELIPLAGELALIGNQHAAADALMACYLAQGALHGSVLNIRTNLNGIRDEKLRRRWVNEALRLQVEVTAYMAELVPRVEARLLESRPSGRRPRLRPGNRPDHG